MIVSLQGEALRAATPALGRILYQCVLSGASVSFMHPFPEADAKLFFDKVADSVDRGERILLAARLDGQWAGTVQVVFATPPNQPHRAEIAKLLVAPDFRRRGIARQLMIEAESAARKAGKTLLMLDTVYGDSAEPLYRSLGYTELGVVPNYALYPDGRPAAAIFFWKALKP
jgi:GNAT superfamily N-acetyltransferase